MLIEVAIALAVAAIVMLIAGALVGAASDAAHYQAQRIESHERAAEAERTLRRLVNDALAADGDSAAFVGSNRFASFRSWCLSPGGWRERCSVTVFVDTTNGCTCLALKTGDRYALVRPAASSVALAFLVSANSGGIWASRWAEPALPLALGVIVDGDTTILRIGAGT